LGADYVVKQIQIAGSFKNWGDLSRFRSGVSGGSEFEITVIPKDSERNYWTPQEAEVVAFDVRMRIHAILMADAQSRGVVLPVEAHTAILKYRERVEKLRAGLDTVEWRDEDVSPPDSDDLISPSAHLTEG
jgi:hypothetical protein